MWKIQSKTLMPKSLLQFIARHARGCLYLKLHPRMILVPGWNYSCRWWNVSYCLHVFAEMKFHSGMKSSLFMVKYLLLFTRFCRDEISSRDELIPVKKTETKFHPWMKKGKKRLVNTLSRDEILKWAWFFKKFFWRVYSNMLSKINVFEWDNIIRVWMCWNVRPLYKKWSPKIKRMRTTSKKSKM